MKKHVLIVEDEAGIREMIAFVLRRAEFEPILAEDTTEAQQCIMEQVPDVILLDWMLPGMSGIDYARRLRREKLTRDIPIIMLTARGEEDDRVHGLEVGADDYLIKPFSNRELVARLRAVLRRSGQFGDDEVIEQGNLRIDTASHRIHADGKAVNMGPTEYRLIHFFMTHPERVYSRGQLLDHVWGGNVYVEERTVDVHIRRLRKSLADQGCDAYIQTVRGAGYRFSIDH
jgi:two-component system phosphate regulon response regulator PhoB